MTEPSIQPEGHPPSFARFCHRPGKLRYAGYFGTLRHFFDCPGEGPGNAAGFPGFEQQGFLVAGKIIRA
jgi:hypothetical protein